MVSSSVETDSPVLRAKRAKREQQARAAPSHLSNSSDLLHSLGSPMQQDVADSACDAAAVGGFAIASAAMKRNANAASTDVRELPYHAPVSSLAARSSMPSGAVAGSYALGWKSNLDERIQWLCQRACPIMCISRSKLDTAKSKFAADAVSLKAAMEFFEDGANPVCVLSLNKDGESFSASLDLPTQSQLKKGKVLVAQRIDGIGKLKREDVNNKVCFMELSKDVTGILETLVTSVYSSTFNNPYNEHCWADLYCKELMDQFNGLHASVQITTKLKQGIVFGATPPQTQMREGQGNMVDKTHKDRSAVYSSTLNKPYNVNCWADLNSKELMDQFNGLHASVQVTAKLKQGIVFLATPPQTQMREGQGNMVDKTHKDRVQLYENSIVMWTSQIKNELQRNPEDALALSHHPEPLEELLFWRERYQKLHSISTQLASDPHKKLQKELDRAKSACTPSFSKLNRDVDMKKDEAESNHKLLEFIRPDFQAMQKDDLDFLKLSSFFSPVMHKILLIWQHSSHYHSPARLVVLFRMICNTVIAQATRFVSGPQIFSLLQNEEPHIAVEKLEITKDVCRRFRETFRNKKAESDDIAKDKDCLRHSSGGWLLQTSNIFCRLDKFQERCEDILDFTRTVINFTKLEKIDIGGSKGKAATAWVAQIYKEFLACVEKFQQVEYDIMDVDEVQFDEDYNVFKSRIKELDRRLAAVFEKGFESNCTINGRIKLFLSFEVFAERPLICGHLALKFKELLTMYKQDLATVHDIFTSAKSQEDLPGFAGMPPTAGAIYWVRCLNQRICAPKETLARLNKIVSAGDDTNYALVESQHNNMMKLLEKFEQVTFNEWSLTCSGIAQKRQQKLLRRDPKTCLMRVNFDPHVSAMLKEVHYLKLIYDDAMIPSEALEVYSQMVEFRQWINRLNDIVSKYNSVLTELLPVEKSLLYDRTTKMEESLRQGITDLKWQSDPAGVDEFLTSAAASVKEVFDVVNIMKGNLKDISGLLAKWCSTPLLERSNKPQKVEEFDKVHKSLLQGKFMVIQDDAQSIHDKLKDSLAALNVPKTSVEWRSYVDFVNNIVIEGFVSAVATSLQCFLEYLDPLMISKNESLPLFDVTLVLNEHHIMFDPPFSGDVHAENAAQQTTLRGILDSFLKDFFAMATIANRVDTSVGDYLNEMKEHFQMQSLLALVSELIDNTELKCDEYTQLFYTNSFLFMEDIENSVSEFMKENAKPLVTDFEAVDNCGFEEIMRLIGIEMEMRIPSFEHFDQKIVQFRELAKEITDMKNPVDIHWLRVDAAPVKNTLEALCNKWERRYSDVLVNFTQDLIRHVSDFLTRVDKSLNLNGFEDCPEEEKCNLLNCRNDNIRDVRLSATALQQLWTPLKKALALLKKHDIPVAEDVHSLVDVSPMLASQVLTRSTWCSLTPRCFMVSNQAWLDILSTGNIPKHVIHKIDECFIREIDECAADSSSCQGNYFKPWDEIISSYDEIMGAFLTKSLEGLKSTQAPPARSQSPQKNTAGNPTPDTNAQIAKYSTPNAELRDASNKFAHMGISFAQLRDRFMNLMEYVQKYGIEKGETKLEEELKLLSMQMRQTVEDNNLRERKLRDELSKYQGLNPESVRLEHEKAMSLQKENEMMKARILTYEENLRKNQSSAEGLAQALMKIENLTKEKQALADQLTARDKMIAELNTKPKGVATAAVPAVADAVGITAPKKKAKPVEAKQIIHGEFTVKVISGHKLINKESGISSALMGDKSDPFACVGIPMSVKNPKFTEKKTKTIDNNLDPMWDEDLKFDINYEHPAAPILNGKITIKDKDVAGSNKMGVCSFPLAFTAEHMKYSQQIVARRLDGEKGAGNSGFVKFQWTWKPTGSEDKEPKVLDPDYGGIPKEELEESFAATLWVRMISASGFRDADSVGGDSDPYAYITIEPNKAFSKLKKVAAKTKTIDNDPNPIFNEETKLDINMPKTALPPTFRITMYDSDITLDSTLGHVDVELPTVGMRKQVCMALTDSKIEPAASVIFEYALLEPGKELTAFPVPSVIEAIPKETAIPIVGELTVRMLTGCDFPKMDMGLMGGLADPYCKVLVPKAASNKKGAWKSKTETWNTKTCPNTLDPVWHEQKVFKINFGPHNPAPWPTGPAPAEDPMSIVVEIYDQDTGSIDDKIGKVYLPLTDALSKETAPCLFKIQGANVFNEKGEDAGFIWMELEWRPHFFYGVHAAAILEKDEHGIPIPCQLPVAKTPLDGALPAGKTKKTPPEEIVNGTIAFRFWSCYGLPKMDWFGKSDTYMQLQIPVSREQSTVGRQPAKKAHTWSSKCVKGTLNPTYSDTETEKGKTRFYDHATAIRWFNKDGAAENYPNEKVILSIWDKDTLSRDDAIGKFVFDMPKDTEPIAHRK